MQTPFLFSLEPMKISWYPSCQKIDNVTFPQKFMTAHTKEEMMPTFAEKAYELLRQVPKGRVTTYKEIAHALGTRSYRGVGQAMKNNPYAPEVP